MSDRRRKSLGRDAFEEDRKPRETETVKRLIKGRSPLAPDARKVDVTVRLTPVNLRHIEEVAARLEARGRKISRDELIRIAITLLSDEDVV